MDISALIEAANLLSHQLAEVGRHEPLRRASEQLLAKGSTIALVDFLNTLEEAHHSLGDMYPHLSTIIETARRALNVE